MSRISLRALIGPCIVAAIVLGGCSHKTTIQTSQGGVTVDQSAGGGTTIKTGQGEMTIGKGAVDPAALGLPVYPGASASDKESVAVSDTSKGQGSQVAILTTPDSFDKVYEYYKGQLPAGSEKMKVESGDTELAQFTVGADTKDQKVVMLTGSKGKVTIELTHTTKQ